MEGAQEMMNDALTAEKGGYRGRWKDENFLVSQAAFPSVHG
jgi:hypothetical protein